MIDYTPSADRRTRGAGTARARQSCYPRYWTSSTFATSSIVCRRSRATRCRMISCCFACSVTISPVHDIRAIGSGSDLGPVVPHLYPAAVTRNWSFGIVDDARPHPLKRTSQR